MSDGRGREAILARIRAALADVRDAGLQEGGSATEVRRGYRRRAPENPGSLVEAFVERVRDYRAHVERVSPAELLRCVSARCRENGIAQLLAPPSLARAVTLEGVELIADSGLPVGDLDRIGAALTGCALAIAQTGTIVLDAGERCGRRALTLVPDRHLCVVESDQIVGLLPEAFDRLAASASVAHRPITFVSGPSATSDIELSRVEGLHGPRQLLVFVVDRSA